MPLPRRLLDGLGRDEHFAEGGVLAVLLHALEEGLFDLVLVSRVGLDDVPLLGHDGLHGVTLIRHSHCRRIYQNCRSCL